MKKRVDVVSIKLIKESSFFYEPRIISTAVSAASLISSMLCERDREAFVVACLDTKLQPMNINICSIGTLNSSLVHPREVFKSAILSNAHAIIIGHNHPSGNITPSPEDRAITTRLKECGSLLGISLIFLIMNHTPLA